MKLNASSLVADASQTVLFLRAYTLKRVVRKAGDVPQNKAVDVEAQAQADQAAAAPVAGVEAVSRDDAATEGTIEASDERDGEKNEKGADN